MKKIIIGFVSIIILFFLTAFLVGQCNDEDEENIDKRPQNPCEMIDSVSNIEVEEDNKRKLEKEQDLLHQETPRCSVEITNLENVVIINAVKDISEQLLSRIAYIVSYNKNTRCANWVAWHLTRDRLEGDASRDGVPYYDEDGRAIGIGELTKVTSRNGYIVDMEVDSPRQELDDYKDAKELYNLSHGHLCPAGDNKWSKEAMNQTFLLTNMCPQDAKLNNGAWNKLEEKCRNLTKTYGELYIVAGPIFYNGVTKTIGANRVAVPDAFFKVLLCVVVHPKTIGFIYPNDSGSYGWEKNCCSVDSVEAVTGFDFFSELPDSLENEIESECDTESWK